jgi:hypothetical protein
MLDMIQCSDVQALRLAAEYVRPAAFVRNA